MWRLMYCALSHSHSPETNLNVISHQGYRQHQSNTHTRLKVPKILPLILHATNENIDKNKRYVSSDGIIL